MVLETGGAWLWEEYGQGITEAALGQLKEQWRQFDWRRAADAYRRRVIELHGMTRVLGKPEPLPLDNIFTDVVILDKPQAFPPDLLEGGQRRINGLRLVTQPESQRLFILGQSGSGKTTFLKHLAIQAAQNRLPKMPIFLSLKAWSDSQLDLMKFIEIQFEMCQFPDPKSFVTYVLQQGHTLILGDGLDEVNQAAGQRDQVIRALGDFSQSYKDSQMIISSRIAATGYSFEQFTYVEVAHFNEQQCQTYVRQWFADNPVKRDRFLTKISRTEQRGLQELARVPLLLALLCLSFEEVGDFPERRVEIYEEALEALLKKWDKSREIFRDEIYYKLSLRRKRQLFAHLAAKTFEAGKYFLRQKDVEQQIVVYLQRLPPADSEEYIDGEVILKAIEAQHSILVERARQIYAFAHLSFQEYFTAKYIVDNAHLGTLENLIAHMTEDRWREVFLLAASLLDEADDFFFLFQQALDKMIAQDDPLVKLLHWVKRKAAQIEGPYKPRVLRSIYLYLGLIRALDFDFAFAFARYRATFLDSTTPIGPALAREYNFDLENTHGFALNLACALSLSLALASDFPPLARIRDLAIAYEDISHFLHLSNFRGLARDLDLDPSIDFRLSYALYMGQIFQFQQAGPVKEIRQLRPRYTAFFAETVTESKKLDAQLHQALAALTVPAETASEADWQRFCQALQDLMQTHRDIGHEWHLSVEQIKRLNTYLQANQLLVECLNLAYVSNRTAIENGLLLPPHETAHSSIKNYLIQQFFSKAGFTLRFHSNDSDKSIINWQAQTENPPYDRYGHIFLRYLNKDEVKSEDLNAFREFICEQEQQALANKLAFFISDQKLSLDLLLILYHYKLADDFALIPLHNDYLRMAIKDEDTYPYLESVVNRYIGQTNLYDSSIAVDDPTWFFGHNVTIDRVAQYLREGQHVGIFGLRKMGKTSLINQLRYKLKQDLTCHIDLQTMPPQARYLYPEIIKGLAQNLRLYGPNLPSLQLLKQDFTDEDDQIYAFRTDIETLSQTMRTKYQTHKFVIFLDEVDRMLPASSEVSIKDGFKRFEQFLAVIRGLAQETRRLVLAVTSVNADINRIPRWQAGTRRDNPFRNGLIECFIPPLAEADTQHMIIAIGRMMGLEYKTDALQELYRLALGHPFLTRQICSTIVEQQSGKEITLEVVNQGALKFLAGRPTYFDTLWRDVIDTTFLDKADAVRALLNLVATEDTSSTSQLAAQINLSLEQTRHLIKDLHELHLLSEDEPMTIKMAILAQWIRQTQPRPQKLRKLWPLFRSLRQPMKG